MNMAPNVIDESTNGDGVRGLDNDAVKDTVNDIGDGYGSDKWRAP